MKSIKFSIVASLLAIFMVAFTSCNKDETSSRMTVRMHDVPADFKAVNVQILEVQAHYEGKGWITLSTQAGIYDLLELQNGVSAVIAEDESIPSGKMTQMRLILGGKNTVETDSEIIDLELSSQDKTGLKINVNSMIEPGHDIEVMLDFDVDQSLVINGGGTIKLKPVIKLESFVQL